MADDLRMAVFAALAISREDCKAFAERHGLDDSTRSFIGNVRAALLQAVVRRPSRESLRGAHAGTGGL
jgi:hypothetical protein